MQIKHLCRNLRHSRHHSQSRRYKICTTRYNGHPIGTLFRPFDTLSNHYFPMVELKIRGGLIDFFKKLYVWNEKNPSSKTVTNERVREDIYETFRIYAFGE